MRRQTPIDKHSSIVRVYLIASAHVRWRRVEGCHHDAAASDIDHAPVLSLNLPVPELYLTSRQVPRCRDPFIEREAEAMLLTVSIHWLL
jgi:hypothetical protein